LISFAVRNKLPKDTPIMRIKSNNMLKAVVEEEKKELDIK
jgi:hypothetical protein